MRSGQSRKPAAAGRTAASKSFSIRGRLNRKSVKRVLLVSAGIIFVGLGGVGMVVPFLPTTPFALCAAWCFGASSPKLYGWLSRTKYFGEYINHYRLKTGVSAKTRALGAAFLWLTLGISAAVFRKPLAWAILLAVGVCVTAHLILIGRSRAADKRRRSGDGGAPLSGGNAETKSP
jgi:uncharacterized membrane protein YbaN (DUF454 family)